MNRYPTVEETEQSYVSSMGDELGRIFYQLYNEVGTLRILWDEYVILFATKPERISILKRSSNVFFRLVQRVFFEHTLLSMCRLTDPSNTGRRTNMSLVCLPALVSDEVLKQQLLSLVGDAHNATEFARHWRNRRIAHSDFALASRQTIESLPAATKADVDAGLTAIAAVLTTLAEHYTGTRLHLDRVLYIGGAESLLHTLLDGIEAEDRWRARLREGRVLADEFRPPREI